MLLNKKYYAEQLSRYQRYSFIMEGLIACGATGSGVAGLAVWKLQTGSILWGVISAMSVVLAIAKPLLKLTEQIEAYAKLYGEYTSAYSRMKMLVDDIQVERDLSPATIRMFQEMRLRAAELSGLGDPRPNPDFVRRLQGQVNDELPADRLWMPED